MVGDSDSLMTELYNIMAFVLIALPLMAALVFMVLPNLTSKSYWLLSSIISVITFGISVFLFMSYDTLTGGTQFSFTVPW